MNKVEIELSIDTDKIEEITKEMIKIGEKYGIEPLIIDNNYICFNLDDLLEIQSKGVIGHKTKMDK